MAIGSGARSISLLIPVLIGFLAPETSVMARNTVTIRVDCREGIGLIPALWRGIATEGALPDNVEVKTVRLDPQLVQTAWDGRLSGGAYDWAALDEILNSAAARGLEMILSVPVPTGSGLEGLWPELVRDTAVHLSGRVDGFEIWGGNGAPAGGDGHYLDAFESAVWTIYRVNPNARVGGPGAGWASHTVELLVKGCSDRSLPLRFVSWRADSVAVDGLRRSIDAVQKILGRHRLIERPRQVIGAWSSRPDTLVAAPVRSVQTLLSVLGSDLSAVCLDLRADPGGLEVLRALQRLGLVRVGTLIDPNPWGLDGIVSLDGEDVIGLFWQTAGEEGIDAAITFSGMPHGQRVLVRRYVIGEPVPADEPVDIQILRLQEPLNVVVPVVPGALTVLSVEVE